MRRAVPGLLSLFLVLAGCSIKQNVTPARFEASQAPQICMIPAKGLRQSFHEAYKAQLERKGFEVIEKPSASSPGICPLSTQYTANWNWDLAMYMSYADIRVFQQGAQIGHANYDAKWGGGRLDKFIDADRKIAELTDQLFPNGAPRGVAMSAAQPAQPLSREAWREQKLQQLLKEDLSYEEYQARYRQIMAE